MSHFRLQLPHKPPGECITSFDELRDWIEGGRIAGDIDITFNESSGTPTVENRDKPWLRSDTHGKLLGWFAWDTGIGKWRILTPRYLGELKTIARTSTTVAKDREVKELTLEYGWRLADSDSIQDLTGNDAFFIGTAPDYDIYTLIRVG